jgi:hypothetical protein
MAAEEGWHRSPGLKPPDTTGRDVEFRDDWQRMRC